MRGGISGNGSGTEIEVGKKQELVAMKAESGTRGGAEAVREEEPVLGQAARRSREGLRLAARSGRGCVGLDDLAGVSDEVGKHPREEAWRSRGGHEAGDGVG